MLIRAVLVKGCELIRRRFEHYYLTHLQTAGDEELSISIEAEVKHADIGKTREAFGFAAFDVLFPNSFDLIFIEYGKAVGRPADAIIES